MDVAKLQLSRRQQQALLALYRGKALGEREALSVRSLVERRELPDSRYAGPLASLEEAGLVAGRRKLVKSNWRGFSSWWLTQEGCIAARGLTSSRPSGEAKRATRRVFEADEALAAGLDPQVRAHAREQAVAETLALEPGPWMPEMDESDWRHGLGLLVLEGLLVREVRIKKRSSLELLGPGDLLRPWTYDRPRLHSEPVPAKWEALTRALLAVLDRQFAVRLGSWPEVTAVLLERAVRRSRSLVIQSAVRQGRQAEERLLLMLWHLAERWGDFGTDGVELRLGQLTPEILARMAGTTPGSAACALERLQEQGIVEQLADGDGWWLSRRAGRLGGGT